MGTWTPSKPCKNCGRKGGVMIRCTNCGTLGCQMCVGPAGRSACKVCKKTTQKVRV